MPAILKAGLVDINAFYSESFDEMPGNSKYWYFVNPGQAFGRKSTEERFTLQMEKVSVMSQATISNW